MPRTLTVVRPERGLWTRWKRWNKPDSGTWAGKGGVNTGDVDDVVAVEVRLADGGSRYFLTWGRIQDVVDPEPICELVLRFSRGFDLGGRPVSARVCYTLREAADSPDAPYFYECYLSFCQKTIRIPRGKEYEAWRIATDEAMRGGADIAYCGRPKSKPAEQAETVAVRD